jgi:molybdate transport system substrate-binding protein
MFGITLVFALLAHLPAQDVILISGGFSVAYQELLPQFEKRTAVTVTTAWDASQGDGPDTVGGQLRRGLPDVVIMSREGLIELLTEGRIATVRRPAGNGCASGTARPDIGAVTALQTDRHRANPPAFKAL